MTEAPEREALIAEAKRLRINFAMEADDNSPAYCLAKWAVEFAQRASVALQSPAPAGWKMVPVEPTEEMLSEADVTYLAWSYPEFPPKREMAKAYWTAMLAASPQPPATAGDGWRDIASAPRDGTPIWAWLNDCGIRAIHWVTAEETAKEEGWAVDDCLGCWCEVGDHWEQWEPQWWLPHDAIAPPAPVLGRRGSDDR